MRHDQESGFDVRFCVRSTAHWPLVRSMHLSPQMEALLHNGFYGNYWVRLTAALSFAFLMGSIPIGPTVRWLFCDLDPRYGRAASAFVPPLNALKGFVPTIIAFHGGGEIVGLLAAFACTLGHYYCPWRRFRGGRSADLMAGIVLALSPPAAAILFAFWLVGTVSSGSQVVGTGFTVALLFFPLWVFLGAPGALFGIAAGAAIALRLGVDGQTLERL